VAAHETVIVLGTSPGTAAAPNVFFTNRIATTAALWKAGKVKRIIVSGDNRRKDYDEPSAMRAALVASGVPRGVIVLDFAGLRTLDTMFRAARVFRVSKALVVTDDWHLPRAIFLADHAGIEATGVASLDVPWRHSPGTRVREILSRVKSVMDIYVLDTKPRFAE
jgi:SanA protein